MAAELFHISPTMLSPGSIILPGNWGRVFRLGNVIGVRQNPQIFIRESTFELIRLLEFSDKPSRLSSLFAFDDIECVRKFISETGRHSEIIYRIAVDEGTAKHRGTLNLGYNEQCGLYDQALEKAREYWRGEATGYGELIIAGNATVIEAIQ